MFSNPHLSVELINGKWGRPKFHWSFKQGIFGESSSERGLFQQLVRQRKHLERLGAALTDPKEVNQEVPSQNQKSAQKDTSGRVGIVLFFEKKITRYDINPLG
jgi:hypothetical protein